MFREKYSQAGPQEMFLCEGVWCQRKQERLLCNVCISISGRIWLNTTAESLASISITELLNYIPHDALHRLLQIQHFRRDWRATSLVVIQLESKFYTSCCKERNTWSWRLSQIHLPLHQHTDKQNWNTVRMIKARLCYVNTFISPL